MAARRSTKFPGVQARESTEKRYKGRPDVCYTIDYKDASGKRVRKDVGWASQGFTAALIHAAKSAQAMGQVAMPAGQAPTLLEAWELYRKDWLEAKGKRFAYDQSLINGHLAPIKQKPLNLITPHDLDLIMADMRQQGCAAQTIRLAMGLVSRIMRRMAAWRLYAGWSCPY